MRTIELLHSVARLFDFKIIEDTNGTEYVVYKDNHMDCVGTPPEDRTAFEALVNHYHISVRQKKSDFDNACFIAQSLGNAQLAALKQAFPNKKFIVFVSVHKDEIIIRFHQKWANEPVYYDVNGKYEDNPKLFAFE